MRLCVCVPCFFPKLPLQEAIRKIAALGYDATELWGWEGLDVEAVRAAMAETGLELLSMCTTEFNMTDPAKRQAWLDGLAESCQAADRMGVKRLITQVGPDTGAERGLQHESIVAALTAAKPRSDSNPPSSRSTASVLFCFVPARSRPKCFAPFARTSFSITVFLINCPMAQRRRHPV